MANLNTHKPHTVYTRSTWTAAWVAVPYLYADNFTVSASPGVSSANLQYRYGHKIRPGRTVAATYTPLDLAGKYIKISVDGGPTWYGVCVDTEDQREGEKDAGAAATLTGVQQFICRGLEYFLQRDPITTSVVKSGAGEQTIGRAIGFNLGAGLPSSGLRENNMSPAAGALSPFVFAETLQTALPWQAHQILDYLIKYLFPRTQGGLDNLGWTYSDGIARQYLSPYKPTLQIDGKTAWQVLNELITWNKLLGWWIYVDPANEVPEIRIFSFNRDVVALPEVPEIIMANGNQIANWDFDRENQVEQCVLATDNAAKFDRVLVKGEPPGAVFTVSIQNGLLETDWTSAQQVAYRDGATADPAYAAYDDDRQRMDANQQARSKGGLEKVFRFFRISPTAFTGSIGGDPLWPYGSKTVDGIDQSAIPTSFWWPGLRLQDRLPLRTEHDYTNPAAITNAMKSGSKWEYQRPFAYVAEPGERAFFLHKTPIGSIATELKSSGRFWSASLQSQHDAFGIILDVHGSLQHAIAKNSFTPIDDVDEVDYEAAIDYSYIYATVFAEGDGNVTVQWPTQPVIVADTIKELVLFAPNCRLDKIVENTTIDIDNEGQPVLSTGGFIQDDTDHMKNIARSAYEWYGQQRKAIQVTIHDLAFRQSVNVAAALETIYLGSLIRQIGGAANAETINSVVTQMSWDTQSGTTSYLTQFAELDLL